MALRQTFPEFRPVEPDEKFKLLPEPGVVRTGAFRTGGDLGDIITLIERNKVLKIDAAPGAGKTTRLPLELARKTGQLVLLVMPFAPLAAVTKDYLETSQSEVSIFLAEDLSCQLPKCGVVVTHVGWVAALWMSIGKVELPDCYLLQDESHESGASSALMRELANVIVGVRSYVMMTATGLPSGVRPMETKGKVHEYQFVANTFKDPWSVEERRAPWAISKMEGHSLIFEDDDIRAADLMQAYSLGNVACYRWDSRMSPSQLVSDIRVLHEDKCRYHVILADSTFRSGYTLPVSTIIDTGLVTRIAVNTEGKSFFYTRSIYEIERIQARSRGGRMPGQETIYWVPKGDCEKKICDLEQTDAEALVYMLRILGFAVPSQYLHYQMAQGFLPKKPHEALSGDRPLASFTGDVMSSLSDIWYKPTESAESVKISVEQSKGKKTASDSATANEPGWIQDLYDGLTQMSSFVSNEDDKRARYTVPEYGKYIYSADACEAVRQSILFPEGVDSVLRHLVGDQAEAVVAGWGGSDRRLALSLLLNQYNSKLIHLRAATNVMKMARNVAVTKDHRHVRKWAIKSTEVVTGLVTQTKLLYKLVVIIARGRYYLEADVIDFSEAVSMLESELRAQFNALSNARKIDRDKFISNVTKELPPISENGSASSVNSSGSITKAERFLMWVGGVPLREQSSKVQVLRRSSVGSSASSRSS